MVCCRGCDGDFTTAPKPTRFSFSGERKTRKRKSRKGDAPLTPAVWGRHHNRMWKQWGGVSTGRTTRTGQSSPFKRPAANNLCGGIVPHGSLTDGFSTNTATFFAVHFTSVAAATGRTRSLGGLGGRSRLEFRFSSRVSDESRNSRSGAAP